ncbi:MAG: bifunctional glutamate N-acetyltransferase/amino-acid acetyltransferase ArgJ [Alphaproteobacteria bacterium]|nr:bifunctional glutamate N-acetyltransferase/amino-acid acetyltransferase ArgJ [Alphaproteobacteria bacterium]
MAKDLPRSPLAPASPPRLTPVAGVRVAGVAAGIKKTGARDLFLAELAPGTTIAGALTRSLCPSAPVDWCRRHLPRGKARAIVVNSGNANAFNGIAGEKAVKATAAAAAAAIGCKPSEVFLASTGVIGQPLDSGRVVGALAAAQAALGAGNWDAAAEAIRTTDTFAKAAGATVEIDGATVSIVGIAKGSGMIAPDMATMLSFVFTDAKIDAKALQAIVRRATDRTFNAITVDSDTSTSDTVLVAATGAAAMKRIKDARGAKAGAFAEALEGVMRDLALQVVRDGEGAQKLIEIAVTGAATDKAARRIGLSIANSPLVKTAIAGEDANWGRIVMAVGKAGEKADRDKLRVAIGGVEIARKGQPVDGYDEAPVARHLKGREIMVAVDIGIGKGRATVWTCDLTHGYISINADYRS